MNVFFKAMLSEETMQFHVEGERIFRAFFCSVQARDEPSSFSGPLSLGLGSWEKIITSFKRDLFVRGEYTKGYT